MTAVARITVWTQITTGIAKKITTATEKDTHLASLKVLKINHHLRHLHHHRHPHREDVM